MILQFGENTTIMNTGQRGGDDLLKKVISTILILSIFITLTGCKSFIVDKPIISSRTEYLQSKTPSESGYIYYSTGNNIVVQETTLSESNRAIKLKKHLLISFLIFFSLLKTGYIITITGMTELPTMSRFFIAGKRTVHLMKQ